MGQSLSQVYLHIVFGTKYRKPFIQKPFDEKLYAYLYAVCKDHHSPAFAIGGYVDHVHILCRLSPRIAISDLLYKIKSNSSRWFKELDPSLKNFTWQRGYGCFSVSERGIDRVRNYILNQEEHHQKKDFRNEIAQLMEEHQLPYDERYFWR